MDNTNKLKKVDQEVNRNNPIMPISPLQPAEVVEQATIAAQTLKKVLEGKAKKVLINGEQYLEFEDWQTLGRFYGYTVAATETTEIWREGKLIGFAAKAVIYQNGQIASNAESSCMRDEPNWKSRPEFMLKSMAQTRACAKALRNVLAWVAVLAGYKPTPAEEMDGLNGANNDQPASEKQVNFVSSLLDQKGYSEEDVKKKYGVSVKELTRSQASQIIENLQKVPVKGSEDVDIEEVNAALDEKS